MATKQAKQKPDRETPNEVFSHAPNGEAFALPHPDDYAKEFKRLKKLVAAHRKQGREIVVVMGVGFVGAVMAGVIADSGINGDILGNREAVDKVSPFIPPGAPGDLGNREAIDKVSPFIPQNAKFQDLTPEILW